MDYMTGLSVLLVAVSGAATGGVAVIYRIRHRHDVPEAQLAMVSANRTSKINAIWNNLGNRAFRSAYIAGSIGSGLASQIFALRNQRGWKQSDLASEVGMKQARISILENSCEDVSLNTLKRLALAFDVALIVKFVSFKEMVLESVDSQIDRHIPPFDRDVNPATENRPINPAPYRPALSTKAVAGRDAIACQPPPISN